MNIKKILLVGSGAREHAIAQALHRSPKALQLFTAASSFNPGIKVLSTDYVITNLLDTETLLALGLKWQVDMVVIGPEAPLAQGVADVFANNQITVIGPKKSLARIETSKAFARELMHDYQIEGLPRYRRFTSHDSATTIMAFLAELGEGQYVVKADGLMGGKGVKVAGEHLQSFDEALDYAGEILSANQSVVIEEKLIGEEFSLMCFCDGQTIAPMPLVQDHKRAHLNDQGPNTGGMGSYSCSDHSLPFLTAEDVEDAENIMMKVLHALQMKCVDRYIGILYGSFIATRDGIAVIEFNARFGDPEVLNVLTILETDLLEIFEAMDRKMLHEIDIQFEQAATVCKYKVPQGYPDAPVQNEVLKIDGVDDLNNLYYAAIDMKEGQMVATGSRTAAYVGVAETLALAEEKAESNISKLRGAFYHRSDIGSEALINKRIAHMQKLRGA